MDKKKGGFLRGIVDNFRSSVSSGAHSGLKSSIDALEIDEPLRPENFEITQVVRYGFPNKPSAVAYDPLQRLVAIGSKTGHIRIIGKPGVDLDIETVENKPVAHLAFIVAESILLCVTADSVFYLYKLKGTDRQPRELNFKFTNKDAVTFLYAPISCKWIYFGTERGNIHVFNIEQGYLSDYVINWNKAIELSRKSHPGSVVHISELSADNSRLLIGYSSGFIIQWDIRNKQAEFRITHPEPITSISWHHEGKQFLVSHTDGSISTWTIKTSKPNSIVFPHAKVMIDESRPEPCKPIQKVQWKTSRNTADSFIIFSGGLPLNSTVGRSPANQAIQPTAKSGGTPIANKPPAQELENTSNDQSSGCLTIIHGKATTVLEMEYPILDFVVCCEQLYEVEANDPYAVIVLLTDDLVVIDLTSKDFPCFRSVHTALQLHQQLPISACSYLVDIPMDLNTALYTAGLKCTTTNAEVKNVTSSSCNKRTKSGQAGCTNTERLFSSKDWPLSGGEWSSSALPYAELVITGHLDGSIKFWDCSSSGIHLVLKIRTNKLFQRTKLNASILQQTHSSGSAGSPNATQTSQTITAATVSTGTTSKYQMSAFKTSQQKSSINQSNSPQQSQPQQIQQSSTTTTYSPVHTPTDNKDISNKELNNQKNQLNEPFKAFIETPFAIEHICFSSEDKVLIIASSCSHIIFFKFNKTDVQSEVPSMLINLNYENEETKVHSETSSNETEQVTQGISGLLKSSDDTGSAGRGCQSTVPSMNSNLYYMAKKELIRRAAGFQPELIIHTPFINEKQGPPKITSLAYLSLNYLLAYGNENGITIVDIIQKSVVFNISTPDIYGPMDPFQRYGKSPKKPLEPGQTDMDRNKSPTDQQQTDCNYLDEKMTKEEYDKIKEKNLNTINQSIIRPTFDPIYYPLDDYDNFCNYRRPEIENLGDLNKLTELNDESNENKEEAPKKKNRKFSSWLNSYYSNSDYSKLPKRQIFEEAIDRFIDENYLIGSKLKTQLKEIDELVNQLETGIEITEDFNLASCSQEGLDKDSEILNTSNNDNEMSINESANDDETIESKASSSDILTDSSVAKSNQNEIPKILAPFIHKKFMKDDNLIPFPWQTKKLQSYPFLPPDHKYIIRHVFGIRLEDTICRCIWFDDEDDLSFKLRHESTYLDKIKEWREKYSSEELDLLLNTNIISLDNGDEIPVKELLHPKLDPNEFDFNKFQMETNKKRLEIQHLIKTSKESKNIKDCTSKIPDLSGRRHSKSFIKSFKALKTHSTKKADTFSRSSSVCSIESTGLEPISNIVFAFTYPNKNDSMPCLSLWIGTKFGTVTAFPLTFPESQESRELCLQTINIQNSNTVFRLKGNILNMTILDLGHNGQVLVSASKGHQPNRNSKGHASNFTVKTRATSSNLGSPGVSASNASNMSSSSGLPSSASNLSTGTSSTAISGGGGGNDSGLPSGSSNYQTGQNISSTLPINTQQLLLICSERQARVVALPSQQMIGKCILSQSTLAVRADVVHIKTSDSHCLFVYFANGQVICYALPSLRIIKELELEVTSPDFKIESNLNFNLDGNLIHFASQSELAKYCANSALHDNLLSLKPTLAKDLELPEPPKQGFIKAIFSVGASPFEKDEIFATSTPQASTSSRTASAKQFKPQTGIQGMRQAADGTLAGEIAKTRQAFAERGEQIEKLENATEKMANEASNFRDLSSQLVNKYKEKKWYNF